MNEKSRSIYDFLCNEGFRPRYDDNNDIVFKVEGEKYYIDFDEDIICFNLEIIITFNKDKILNIYDIIYDLNYISLGKCTIDENDNKFISLKIENLESSESFNNNFYEYLKELRNMESILKKKFYEVMS